jgi:McrBC 5-methylcytosine restriction system component
MPARSIRVRRPAFNGLKAVTFLDTVTFNANDCSTARLPATFLLRGQTSRDPSAQIARLADQFVEQNRARFRELELNVGAHYDGASVTLVVQTGIKIGAVPLISPTTGRSDYGFVVRPRFEWTGVGEILGATGWRVVPAPLRLPLLPRSERKIPPWVLSSMIISRIQVLLRTLERRFEMKDEIRTAPRGRIDWRSYAQREIARSRFLNVPCRFPNLQDDRELKAAIRFTLEKQLGSLLTQRTAGLFVFRLMEICQQLLESVRDVAPREPTPATIYGWFRRRLTTESFRDGIQAIEWTAQDRGLAGLSDLEGLPWSMSMDEFFEAWAETVLAAVARKIGGVLRTGRQRETVTPLSWDPPYLGSQKSLVPDLVLEREDQTVIVDAKYKEHWEEMQRNRWTNLDEEIRERHREDLLQVLAYANLSNKEHTTVCLVYPCLEATWESLRARNMLFNRASIGVGTRRVDLALTALPISTRVLGDAVELMAREFSRAAE